MFRSCTPTADRGGTDSPLDGDLRINDTTDLSRIQWDGSLFSWNDNDDPGSTSLRGFYGPGGDGNGLTIYVTVNDGGTVSTASFDVATYYPGDANAGSNFIRWGDGTPLPAGGHGACSTGWPLTIASSSLPGGGSRLTTVDADPVDGRLRGSATRRHLHAQTGRRPRLGRLYTVPPAEITYARGVRSFAVDADPVSVEYFVHIALVSHVSVAAPPIVKWLRLVGLPWSNISRRWKIAEAQGRVMQRLVTAGGHAMREWWPLDRACGWTRNVGQDSTAPAAYRRDGDGVPRENRQPKARAGRYVRLGA